MVSRIEWRLAVRQIDGVRHFQRVPDEKVHGTVLEDDEENVAGEHAHFSHAKVLDFSRKAAVEEILPALVEGE